MPVRIVPYAPQHHAAFKALNEAWITHYFTLEDLDRRALDDPDTYILARGGQVFVALDGESRDAAPIGVCALIPMADEPGTLELAKMAVAEVARGRGVGQALGEAAIAWARESGAARIYLESNSVLKPALRLYRRLGFTDATGFASPYCRCDVQMVLPLQTAAP